MKNLATDSKTTLVYVKGAPEKIVELCRPETGGHFIEQRVRLSWWWRWDGDGGR